jgi:hypothetical protein
MIGHIGPNGASNRTWSISSQAKISATTSQYRKGIHRLKNLIMGGPKNYSKRLPTTTRFCCLLKPIAAIRSRAYSSNVPGREQTKTTERFNRSGNEGDIL